MKSRLDHAFSCPVDKHLKISSIIFNLDLGSSFIYTSCSIVGNIYHGD
jgi:transcription elongation factor Elf1